jgi:hypothetical protein
MDLFEWAAIAEKRCRHGEPWDAQDWRLLAAACQEAKAKGQGLRWAAEAGAGALGRGIGGVKTRIEMRGWWQGGRAGGWGLIPNDGRYPRGRRSL